MAKKGKKTKRVRAPRVMTEEQTNQIAFDLNRMVGEPEQMSVLYGHAVTLVQHIWYMEDMIDTLAKMGDDEAH